MVDRIDEVLARVPATKRSAALNDARTMDALTEGLEPRLVDWALSVAHGASEEAYGDVSPARYENLAEPIGKSIESISINLIRFLVAGRDSAASVRVSRAQRDSTLQAVHMHIPLERIVRGMRALDHRWRRAFIEIVVGSWDRADTIELLSGIDRSLSIYFGALIDQNAQIYTDEHERLREQRVVSQRQVLERLIGGAPVDDEAIADVLGIRPDQEHTGLVVSPADLVEPGAAPLDFAGFRRAVTERFAHCVVTAVPVDQDTMWILVTSPHPLGPDVADRLADIIADRRDALVSIGLSAPGTTGLRTTLVTARAAHGLNRLSRRIGPLVSFAGDGLLALAAQSPDLARLFVEREIGPLLEPDALMDELRTTLETVIRVSGSLVRASEILYVHRNTIAYRLKRAEQILGRNPLERPVETRVALLLAAHL